MFSDQHPPATEIAITEKCTSPRTVPFSWLVFQDDYKVPVRSIFRPARHEPAPRRDSGTCGRPHFFA